jgi:hypothetical protein
VETSATSGFPSDRWNSLKIIACERSSPTQNPEVHVPPSHCSEEVQETGHLVRLQAQVFQWKEKRNEKKGKKKEEKEKKRN